MKAKVELSRSAIVERALEIADLEGIGAITVRRLATEFGVTPMALYWHVENKDELFAAMGQSFFAGLEVPAQGTWQQRLRAITHALVDAMRRHPGSAHLAPAQTLACEDGRAMTEQALSVLRDAGFTLEQTTNIARTAMQTAMMLVIDQAGAEVGVAAEERAAVIEGKRKAIAQLSPERYPNLVLCADALTCVPDVDGYFDFGIDLYVSGVEKLHAAQKRSRAKAQSVS